MNKLVIAFVALAVCAFAGSFTPKEFGCSTHLWLETTVSQMGQTFTLPGDVWILAKGDELFMRTDMDMMVFNMSVVMRSDQKKDGKILVITRVGECSENYDDAEIEYSSAFDYDSKEDDVDCPYGGKCTKYCNSTENTCYFVDSDKKIVKIDNEDGSTVIHYTDDPVSPDVFAVEKCDGTKLPVPTNPCTSHSSSTHPGSQSSHTQPSGSDSASSLVKASYIAVLAGLIGVLF